MSASAALPVPAALATVASWQAGRDEVAARLAPCVPRPETRRRLQAYVDGLLSDTRRKNGWQLVETVGEATPFATKPARARCMLERVCDAGLPWLG